MRGVLVAAAMVLAAIGCSGIEPGAVHPPDSLADGADVADEPGTDPGGHDAYGDAGPRLDTPPGDEGMGPDDAAAPDEGVGPEEADIPEDVDTMDNPDVEEGPGTIQHFGWFGPGGVGFGGGVSAFWSGCGPRQAWRVQ